MVTERIFQIIAARHAETESALVRFAAKMTRKGLVAPAWSWGMAYTDTGTGNAKIPLTVTGDTPRFQGWTFAAIVSTIPTEAGPVETIVRALPGFTIPVDVRSRPQDCDHCRVSRRRSDTYVVAHETDGFRLVGSTCIADFLGHSDALKIAAQAQCLAEMLELCEDGESGSWGGTKVVALDAFLPKVAAHIRECGWISRGQARERRENGEFCRATADEVFDPLDKTPRVAATLADIERAATAREWAIGLIETDIGTSDYLRNVAAVARAGLVTSKCVGIAASIIVAHDRAIERAAQAQRTRDEKAASTYVGTVGAHYSAAVTLAFQTSFDTQFGRTFLYSFRDDSGNVLVWKASSGQQLDTGRSYFVRGTVKAHAEYKGTRQTNLTRCAVSARSCTCPKCKGSGKAPRGGICKGCDGFAIVCDFSPEVIPADPKSDAPGSTVAA